MRIPEKQIDEILNEFFMRTNDFLTIEWKENVYEKNGKTFILLKNL